MKKLIGIASVFALLVSASPVIAKEAQPESAAVVIASIYNKSLTLDPEERRDTPRFTASSNSLTLTVDQSSDGSRTHFRYTLWDDNGNQVGRVFKVETDGSDSTTWDVKKGKKYFLQISNRSTHNGIFIEASTEISID
ncbi:hypothetical protein P4V47_16185 [Brevibacillus laterosporus]|uniref:hypothetical protein n=1 Tax=Brevibacillus laterosporus TaxID=1465 RepID=UPI002E24DB85|nr:hypothetical protein [Brevibacillus laterosporus]